MRSKIAEDGVLELDKSIGESMHEFWEEIY